MNYLFLLIMVLVGCSSLQALYPGTMQKEQPMVNQNYTIQQVGPNLMVNGTNIGGTGTVITKHVQVPATTLKIKPRPTAEVNNSITYAIALISAQGEAAFNEHLQRLRNPKLFRAPMGDNLLHFAARFGRLENIKRIISLMPELLEARNSVGELALDIAKARSPECEAAFIIE